MNSVRMPSVRAIGAFSPAARKWMPKPVRSIRNHRPPARSSGADQNRHSVVTDSTMMMASTNGTSLVMRQKRPEYFDVPAAILRR